MITFLAYSLLDCWAKKYGIVLILWGVNLNINTSLSTIGRRLKICPNARQVVCPTVQKLFSEQNHFTAAKTAMNFAGVFTVQYSMSLLYRWHPKSVKSWHAFHLHSLCELLFVTLPGVGSGVWDPLEATLFLSPSFLFTPFFLMCSVWQLRQRVKGLDALTVPGRVTLQRCSFSRRAWTSVNICLLIWGVFMYQYISLSLIVDCAE